MAGKIIDLKNVPVYCIRTDCDGLEFERCICLTCTKPSRNSNCHCDDNKYDSYCFEHGEDNDYIKCDFYEKDWIKVLKYPGMVVVK